MPKIIELTVELEIQKVSCPGVWLCQDGLVSLTVHALGTSYQTCLLPPVFPLMFRDVFYFRKNFQQSCSLNNICCILNEETIYCELVQWSNSCVHDGCVVLAQYLGAINDILFPPNSCSNEGVDLLMRRSEEFPGILSPKIEIATKMRIDEVWDQRCNLKKINKTPCHCSATHSDNSGRQRQVCHSAQYHRNKCHKQSPSAAPSRSRSRSGGSRSCCSLTHEAERTPKVHCECHTPSKSRTSLFRRQRSVPRRRQYQQYNVCSARMWPDYRNDTTHDEDYERSSSCSDRAKLSSQVLSNDDRIQRLILESRYIEHEPTFQSKLRESEKHKHHRAKITPCVCEICRRYHELFHTTTTKS